VLLDDVYMLNNLYVRGNLCYLLLCIANRLANALPFAQLVILHRYLYLHNFLALGPMSILRTIPVNLLAVSTAVAIRLASLAELARIGIQFNGANGALCPNFAER